MKNELFEEAEMLAVCKELGIEVSRTGGYPTLRGVELTPELITKILTGPSEYEVMSNIESKRNIVELPFYVGQRLFLIGRDVWPQEPKMFSFVIDSIRIGYDKEISLYGRVCPALGDGMYCYQAITIGKRTIGSILFYNYEDACKVFENKKANFEKGKKNDG